MNTELPIYMLDITEDIEDDAQVDFIALVDRPAIQKNWNAFNKTQKFEVTNEDRRIISGAIMLADTPIFRSDATYGDYYVAFSADTILKIVQKFFKKGFQSNVNLMHNSSAQFEGVTLFESFISVSKLFDSFMSVLFCLADIISPEIPSIKNSNSSFSGKSSHPISYLFHIIASTAFKVNANLNCS